jgi:hypothetical protein
MGRSRSVRSGRSATVVTAADDQLTDEDSSYGPVPPPPDRRHPEEIMAIATAESYEVEEEDYHSVHANSVQNNTSYADDDDDDDNADFEKTDPPAEMTQDEESGEDIDFEEDQSVEIPPTTVVQKMLLRENLPKESRKFARYAAAAACCLILVVIILSAGYGSGAFKDDESTSKAIDGGGDGGGDGDGPAPVPVPAPEASVPSQSPTEAPITQETLERPAAMRQYLASVNVGGLETLGVANSPENLALTWLTSDDVLQLDPTLEADQFRIRQRYALLAIWFNSNDDWNDVSGWLSVEDECAGWFGINCDANGAVTSIDLESNNIQGNIPADISMLTDITVINLSNNVITGAVPAELATLAALEELYLSRNLINMEFSNYDLSSLVSLTVLELNNNAFVGSLPESLWTLTGLEILVLDTNFFSGALSGSISQLVNLSKCSLFRRHAGCLF